MNPVAENFGFFESDKDADTTAKFTRDTTGLFIYA